MQFCPFSYLLIGLLLGSCSLSAQTDSIASIPEVLIRGQRAERNGYVVWQADSLPVNSTLSLSERLYWDNAVDVKPYAPGTLSTLSIRGAGPKRSPVFWNGLPLQSTMNGVVDLSLVPFWAGDRLEVHYGGQSAAQSSGSLGGSVRLESQPMQAGAGFFGTASVVAGSWGHIDQTLAAGFSGQKFATQLRGSLQRANNNFPYRNDTQVGKPMVRQTNNAADKWDIQQFNQWKINTKNTLSSAVWSQRAFREIPPTMTQTPTDTWQRDRSTRAVITWENRPATKSIWQTRAAWLDEGIFFYLYGKTDSSRARTVLLHSDFSTTVQNRYFFKSGINVQQQWANADGYADSTTWYGQTRLAAYATGERQFRKGSVSLLIRQEWAQVAAFSWSAGGRFEAGPGQLHFHLSRNFNLPTFNDRFWLYYGKPDLMPEKGYSTDIGWKYDRGAFSSEVSVFQIWMDNWIDWQPVGGIFRPFNLKKVWSRGLAWNGAWRWQKGCWHGQISGQYQYVRATNEAVYAGEPDILNKQLTYTPNHSASLGIRAAKGSFSGAYLHQWTGPRFITTDNTVDLPGFQTGQLFLRYGLAPVSEKLSGFSVGFRLQNVWNTPYQVLQYRPMPGRGWRVECSYAW